MSLLFKETSGEQAEDCFQLRICLNLCNMSRKDHILEPKNAIAQKRKLWHKDTHIRRRSPGFFLQGRSLAWKHVWVMKGQEQSSTYFSFCWSLLPGQKPFPSSLRTSVTQGHPSPLRLWQCCPYWPVVQKSLSQAGSEELGEAERAHGCRNLVLLESQKNAPTQQQNVTRFHKGQETPQQAWVLWSRVTASSQGYKTKRLPVKYLVFPLQNPFTTWDKLIFS